VVRVPPTPGPGRALLAVVPGRANAVTPTPASPQATPQPVSSLPKHDRHRVGPVSAQADTAGRITRRLRAHCDRSRHRRHGSAWSGRVVILISPLLLRDCTAWRAAQISAKRESTGTDRVAAVRSAASRGTGTRGEGEAFAWDLRDARCVRASDRLACYG
jgi:hypothetical protein